MKPRNIGIAGEWILTRTDGFDEFLANVMQLGWIKRSVGGLLEGRKTGGQSITSSRTVSTL